MGEQNQPVEHLSLRVPWHDAGWNGHVCTDPLGNGTCLLLKNIGENRRDDREVALAGRHIADLSPQQTPPCVTERATFLSDRTIELERQHPFEHKNPAFAYFQPTRQILRPYSAHAVPFRWMIRDSAKEIPRERRVGIRMELENEVDAETGWRSTTWMMHGDNQRALLDAFFENIRPGASLVFFYAKHSPLSDDSRRLLIGAAEVDRVTPSGTYDTSPGAPFPAQLWETLVEHSLRPDQRRGFLLPYQKLLALADTGADISDALAFAPDAGWTAFSYASEHVSHDLAVDALLALLAAGRQAYRLLGRAAEPLGFDWLQAQLNRLWQLRGPCPGLASALGALQVSQPVSFAHMIEAAAGRNADPWPVVDTAMRDPGQFGLTAASHLTPSVRATWQALAPQRRALLELLSRFALTQDQFERYFVVERRQVGLTDADVLANPYLLFECDRHQAEPIPVTVIDRGCFPDPVVTTQHPMPLPSAMADALDARRVRAMLVDELHRAHAAGHTLRPQRDLVVAVAERQLSEACPITGDTLGAHRLSADTLSDDGTLVTARLADGAPALQLREDADHGRIIREQIERRLRSAPIPDPPDFQAALDAELAGSGAPADPDDAHAEQLARQEKLAALNTLYTSKVSVLLGSAGTGKTTLLTVLRHDPAVADGGVLLLAPTGKARVQLTRRVRAEAHTVAQFLLPKGRYDEKTGRYLVTGDAQSRTSTYRTVIIDEASMLTEDQLAAVLDAVTGYQRLILVGDPQQLPPIGAGRPFVDIVRRLRPPDIATRFPRCAPGYAELTVPRRQAGQDRDDLTLASWFSGGDLQPWTDLVWDRLRRDQPMPTLRAVPYQPGRLFDTLLGVLREEVPDLRGVSDDDLITAFAVSYGARVSEKGNAYFGRGAAEKVDAWQILSPVRGRAWGTLEVNRAIKDRFRADALRHATGDDRRRWYAKPIGPERMVVGDKVINVRNHRFPEKFVWPRGTDRYVANGELGVVTGQSRLVVKRAPWATQVEFGGRDASFEYANWSDNTEAAMLELAWAITVHKSQGSEFDITVVVLPPGDGGLTRELLYTALTRQRTRVVLLHAGSLDELALLGSALRSDTARRLTNLFAPPEPVGEAQLERGLIHRTARGELVRSKSEVIIANLLDELGVGYSYEQPFTGKDGRSVRPDFTITTDLGDTVLWEHLGMLADPRYAAKWKAKEQWYRDNGVVPATDGGAGPIRLLVTDERDGVDSVAWRELARKALDG